MRCALSVYSMIRPLRAGKIDLLGVVDFAHNLGYEGLEMLDMCWPENRRGRRPNGSLVDHAHRLRQRGEALGLAISSYAIHNNFAQMDTERQRVEVERVMRAIDVGEELGVLRMRVESTNGPPEGYQGPAEWEGLVPWLVSGIREVAEYAASKHIVLGLENHGRVVGRSTQIEELILKVDSAYFGANPDIGNFYVVDEEPLEAMDRLAKYAVYVHVKDFRREPPGSQVGEGWFESNGGYKLQGSIIGEGVVDVAGCLQTLKRAHYDGFLSLEFEGPEDPRVGCSKGVANLRTILAKL